MKKMRIALATNDGKVFIKSHFGDANFYDVYEITSGGAEFILRVVNDTGEEERHADPKKAGGIAAILKKNGVQIAMTRLFGPNIKRIKSKFVCIMTSHENLNQGLQQAVDSYPEILDLWVTGEERDVLDLRTPS